MSVKFRNGDNRQATIQEYLAEADRCEVLSGRAEEQDRQLWLDLAERWRVLARRLRDGG